MSSEFNEGLRREVAELASDVVEKLKTQLQISSPRTFTLSEVLLELIDRKFLGLVLQLYAEALSKQIEVYHGIFYDVDGERFLSQVEVGEKTTVEVPLSKPVILMLITGFETYPFLIIHTHPQIGFFTIFSPADYKVFYELMFPFAILFFQKGDYIHALVADLRRVLPRREFREAIAELDRALAQVSDLHYAEEVHDRWCEKWGVGLEEVVFKPRSQVEK